MLGSFTKEDYAIALLFMYAFLEGISIGLGIERNDIDGVLFQDISDNPNYWIIDKFQYKKRIQLAIYNIKIMSNFAFHFEAECA